LLSNCRVAFIAVNGICASETGGLMVISLAGVWLYAADPSEHSARIADAL
jgi:hypothetical protein